ncbi:MAG: hypothetical protein CM15mP60_0010 [Alphaproteobacteria bacterium]|nr:MAG: hypothetical protein CM15mP60_0010 [Alphaproteobacteria bacterium]
MKVVRISLSSPDATQTEIGFELQYFNSGSSRKILEIIPLYSSPKGAKKSMGS